MKEYFFSASKDKENYCNRNEEWGMDFDLGKNEISDRPFQNVRRIKYIFLFVL